MPIFARFAYAHGANVFGVLIPRFWIAGILLAIVVLIRRTPIPKGRTLLGLCLMGGLGYVGQSYCYFAALNHADAGLVALLLYLFPFFVLVMAALFLNERVTAGKAMALVVCLVGTALTVGGGKGTQLGIGLGVGAAVVYSLYIVAGAKITKGVDPLAATMVVCFSAGVVFTLMAWSGRVQEAQFPADAIGWVMAVCIACASTVLAVAGFIFGMAKLGAAQASMISTVEPVISIGLAALLLGESMRGVQLVGAGMVLMATCGLAYAQTRDRPIRVPVGNGT